MSIDENNTFCKEDLNNYNIYIGNKNFIKEIESLKKDKYDHFKNERYGSVDNDGIVFLNTLEMRNKLVDLIDAEVIVVLIKDFNNLDNGIVKLIK